MNPSEKPINGYNALSSDPNGNCLLSYYEAFKIADYKKMGECYHTEATFEDPAFGELHQTEVVAMWEMLLSRAKDFSLDYSQPLITSEGGECNCIVSYTFSKTGKTVVNPISSKFVFKDGKIFSQVDKFDLWKWSKQAFGWPALLLGWTSVFKRQLRDEARNSLLIWMQKNNRT